MYSYVSLAMPSNYSGTCRKCTSSVLTLLISASNAADKDLRIKRCDIEL